MKSQALWLPGDFPTTNELLNLTRVSGYYAGNRIHTGQRKRKNERDVNETFARIRNETHVRARAVRMVPVEVPSPVIFVHLGSGRRDPSSWYLSAKAIEDGLVDAGVLPTDRAKHVAFTAGRSVRANDPVWQRNIAELTQVETGGREGMFVLVGVADGFGVL